MAFTGVQNNILATQNKFKCDGLALTALAGPFTPDASAGDSGVFSSDQTAVPPLNLLPANFGPGAGNWTQAALDEVEVILNDAAPLPCDMVFVKTLVGNDIEIGVHSRGANPPVGIEVSLNATHTVVR
jgi:hypothetical protein